MATRTLQVILDEDFNIIGTAQGGTFEEADVTVGVTPAAGQHVVEVELPEEVTSISQPAELHARLRSYVG